MKNIPELQQRAHQTVSSLIKWTGLLVFALALAVAHKHNKALTETVLFWLAGTAYMLACWVYELYEGRC